MRTGVIISGAAHAALIALAVVGLPWFAPREREAIRVTEVSFVSEAEFAAAQAAAPAEAPRDTAAPPEIPAAPEAAAEPPPEPEPAPEPAPLPEIAALDPEAEAEAPPAVPAPDPAAAAPPVTVPGPLAAAAPPRARPSPRVAPEPTPAPPEAASPAATPAPETAPAPEAEVALPEQPPVAPPEAAPEPEVAEPTPPATLALTTSGRPLPRRGNVADPDDAERVLAALQEEIEREIARQRAEEAGATPATPATPPTEPSRTEPTAVAATSLPVGSPLTTGEKDGLRLAVQRCWNVPAGLRDAQELKVTLAAELDPSGQVVNATIRLIEPSPAPDGRFQQAYEAGRRALLRCAPYGELPREKYAQWRNIEVVFNPEGMVSW